MILGRLQYSRWQKYRLETPKPQIKNISKNEFWWFVLYDKLVAFFRNFSLHVDIILSVTFIVQKFPNHGTIRSPMQWRPLNRKLSVCLTGNEINNANSNIKIDCWTLDIVFFAIHSNLEQQFADYLEKAFIFSGHFQIKIWSCCYFLFWPLCTWIDPVTRLGNLTEHCSTSYEPWCIFDYI